MSSGKPRKPCSMPGSPDSPKACAAAGQALSSMRQSKRLTRKRMLAAVSAPEPSPAHDHLGNLPSESPLDEASPSTAMCSAVAQLVAHAVTASHFLNVVCPQAAHVPDCSSSLCDQLVHVQADPCMTAHTAEHETSTASFTTPHTITNQACVAIILICIASLLPACRRPPREKVQHHCWPRQLVQATARTCPRTAACAAAAAGVQWWGTPTASGAAAGCRGSAVAPAWQYALPGFCLIRVPPNQCGWSVHPELRITPKPGLM